MDQRINKIFISDIEVPDIVQQKADIAFSQIRKEKVEKVEQKNKKVIFIHGERIRRMLAAAAACAVLATAIGVGDLYKRNSQPQDELATAENYNANKNPFVLTVNAKGLDGEVCRELENGVPVAIDVEANGWVIGADEDGMTDYCINLPLSCEGENIENITYSINKGAFQIVENENASIVVSGRELTEIPNVGQIGGGYDEENDGTPSYPVSVKYYTEFTLDYESQSFDSTWINMCNVVKLSNLDLIWGENATLEDMKKGYDELVEGVVITCKVQFTDGTSEVAELEVGTVLATPKEAGFEEKTDTDSEEIFFTFKRK